MKTLQVKNLIPDSRLLKWVSISSLKRKVETVADDQTAEENQKREKDLKKSVRDLLPWHTDIRKG